MKPNELYEMSGAKTRKRDPVGYAAAVLLGETMRFQGIDDFDFVYEYISSHNRAWESHKDGVAHPMIAKIVKFGNSLNKNPEFNLQKWQMAEEWLLNACENGWYNELVAKTQITTLYDLYERYGRNTFEISAALCRALHRSIIDESITMTYMDNLPYQYMHFNVDSREIRDHSGGFLSDIFIQYTWWKKGAGKEVGRKFLVDYLFTRDAVIDHYPVSFDYLDSEKESLSFVEVLLHSCPEGDLLHGAALMLGNIILYLNYSERDVKSRYPDNIPARLRASLHGGTRKQRDNAERLLNKRGYSKIHFCGYQMQKEYERLYAETGREVNPHWRRGHWRNQACGPGMKEHKLVWIKPMIVRRDKGEPEYGHIYHVGDTAQP